MGLKLMAELGLDGSGFEAGLKKAESATHHLTESLKGFVIGAVGIATVEQAISKTVETAKELINTSKRLAIAPEQLQVLRQAAKESGTELDALASFFEKIDIARQKALGGGATGRNMTAMFGAVGITPTMLHNQTAAQLAMGPISQTVRSRNPEELGAIFRELGVKGFGPMIAVLKTDFGELGKKMKDMGAIMDTETAVKLKLLSDEFEMIGQILISQLGPALLLFVQALYVGILQLGSKIAQAKAFMEGGTKNDSANENFGWGEKLTQWIVVGGIKLGDKLKYAKEDPESRKRLLEMVHFDEKGGEQAAKDAEIKWQKKIDDFFAKLFELEQRANALKNPIPPDFSKSNLPEKFSNKALQTPSDSLTKVGNFLGGLGVSTTNIDQRKLEYLKQIAANTHAARKQLLVTPPPSPGLSPNNSLLAQAANQTLFSA